MQKKTKIDIIDTKKLPEESTKILECNRPGRKRNEKGKNRTAPDVILKNFWRQNEYFADLINAVVFDGEQRICADMLTEMDTDVSGVISMPDYEESLRRSRDVVKKSASGMEFIVWGLENQQKVHYAMPLRTMIYDALGYLKEYQELVKQRKKLQKEIQKEEHRETGEKAAGSRTTKEEFLSGISREDRFHPQISIVLYYGEEQWDGPRSLEGMMIEMPDPINRIFNNYHMNLVQVTEGKTDRFQNEDVKTVFEISAAILRGDIELVREKYSYEIKSELAQVISAITASEKMLDYAKKRERVNMCKSLEELMERGREEGREEGIKEGIKEKLLSQVAKKIAKGRTPEQIAEDLDEDVAEIYRMVEELKENRPAQRSSNSTLE